MPSRTKGSGNILDKGRITEKYLKLIGRRVIAVTGESETELYAVIEQTYKRNKSHFEAASSKIGRYFNEYYVYYGPASFNIYEMSDDDYLMIDESKYYLVLKEAVKAEDKTVYYRAIIKKAVEEGYAFGEQD